MSIPSFDSIQVGDTLPPLDLPAVNRTMLALFAGASGDHNPIHIDIDFARKAGMPDVLAHGMLGMAWLGRLLTNWAPPSQLRSFAVRFQGVTHLANTIHCSGQIAEKRDADRCVRITLHSTNQHGQTKIAGDAWVQLV